MPGSAPHPQIRVTLARALLTLTAPLWGAGPAVFPCSPVVPSQLRKPPLCSMSIQTPSPEVLAPGQGPAQHSLGIFERHPPFQTCLPGQSWGFLLTGHRGKAMFTAYVEDCHPESPPSCLTTLLVAASWPHLNGARVCSFVSSHSKDA